MAKIAGPSGASQKLIEDIRSLLDAPEDDMLRYFHWLAAPEHPIPSGWRDFEAIGRELDLPREFLNDHFLVIQFIAANWRAEGLVLDEVISDFKEFGIAEEKLSYARTIFGLLEGVKERFFLASLRGRAEISGAATIDEFRAFWDIRPVFEDSPIAPDAALSTDLWLTNTYLLMLEFTYSSRSTQRQSIALQVSESDLEMIEESLSRAKAQLQTLKRKQFI